MISGNTKLNHPSKHIFKKNSKSHVYFLQLNIFGEVCPKCEELPYFLERYTYQGPANAAVEDIFSIKEI